MPLDIIEKIDYIRKDIPRSRFLLRIVENNLAVMKKKKSQSPQASNLDEKGSKKIWMEKLED